MLPGISAGKWQNYTSQVDYAPVIRYAEVLLNYAEALVMDGGVVTQQAVDLLNAVRTRSYPAGAYTLAGFCDSPGISVMQFLLREILNFSEKACVIWI